MADDYSNLIPQYDFSSGSYGASPYDYSTPSMNFDFGAGYSPSSDWFTPSADTGSYSNFGTPYNLPNVDTGSLEQFYMPSETQGMPQSWLSSTADSLGSWASANPDKAVGAGMGVLNGLGGFMNSLASNKLAKKASERNDRLSAYEQAQMERQQKNQALADVYANSVDRTTPNTVTTNFSQDPNYYAHYGEMTGGKSPFVTVTPGETTRVQLASGGLASLGKPISSNHFVSGGAMSGQADNVPAQLSDGEYVMDADSVAALGDGNSAAGAGALDKMRQAIRTHKRSGSVKTIPPKAKPAESYLPKAKSKKVKA